MAAKKKKSRPLSLIPPGAPALREGLGSLTATRLAARVTGARVCFGKPIEAAGRTVVPVASLRVMGGMGFGHGSQVEAGAADRAGDDPETGTGPAGNEGGGGGGGGLLEARPVGFIEIGPDGTRYQAIGVSARVGVAGGALLAFGIARALRAGASSRAVRRLGATGSRSPRRWLLP